MTRKRALRFVLSAALCFGVAACASTGARDKVPPDAKTGKSDPDAAKTVYRPGAAEEAPSRNNGGHESTESPMKAKVTLTVAASNLGDAVRTVGKSIGGNLVLMSGLETRPTNELQWRRAKPAKVAADIAAQGGLAIQETPEYYFLFAPGYEPLVELSLAGRLNPTYAMKRTDVAFGSEIKLFTVFAWMSYALDLTIVADNSVAESRCGELALQQVPLESALEAILKSARVVAFDVESTDEYIFLKNPNNTNPASALLNSEPLDDGQTQTLERRVRVVLPHALTPDQPLEVQTNALPLNQVVDALSQQLGVPVVVEKGLEDLPVNPVVLNNVRVRTALDLLVRQWLVPDFGYQVTHDRIVVRRR